jgi:2-dehydro-3-deoxyglucarate aldolase
MKNTDLKRKLKNRELTVGSWITIGHPSIAEILAPAGFDWLVVDMEHSAIGFETAQILISTIQSMGAAALVRVGKNEESFIKRSLDAGADGIIVPMICSEEDARNAVSFAHYPPVGRRGVGLARAQQYGRGFESYSSWEKDHLVVVAQIEHIDAIKQLDRIIRVPGIDATMIGPYDLSGSLGIPGQYNDPSVQSALDRYRMICGQFSMPMGYHVIEPNAQKLDEKVQEGYTFLAFSTDFLFMGEKAMECMTGVRRDPARK